MKKIIFLLVLISFFIASFLLLKFPIILGFGITVTSIDLLFHTNFLSNCIYLQVFLLDFVLSYYLTYRSRTYIYGLVFKDHRQNKSY